MSQEDLPLVTPLQMALALKALTTAYKEVKKYQRKRTKKSRSKHTAVTTQKSSRGRYQ